MLIPVLSMNIYLNDLNPTFQSNYNLLMKKLNILSPVNAKCVDNMMPKSIIFV